MFKKLSITKTDSLTFSRQAGLLLCLALGLVAYAGMVSVHRQHGTLRDEYTPTTLVWYGLAFGAYLAAILWAERQRGVAPSLLWGGAIAFRVLLLFTTPSLSDDVYRYLWDGYVANQGVSPYAYPIDSPALDPLDIPARSQANNRDMASPYLPAAQIIFAGLTRLQRHPLSLQISMVIFDLLAGLFILRLLKLAQLPAHRLLIYLWNPLVVIEVAHGAHIDAWMIFLTLASLWLTVSPRRFRLATWAAPVVLALATLTKLLPGLLLPVLFWRWRWRQLGLYTGVAVLLLVPVGLQAGWGLTGPLDGTGLFGAIRIYADRWNFNSGLFHWLEVDLLQEMIGLGGAEMWAKRIVLLTLAGILLSVWLRARRRTSLRATLRLMAVPFMAYLLLTTTVHPWYALSLLAFLPFLAPAPGESRWRWLALLPWLYLSATLPLSYLTYLDPLDFRELEWVRRTEWLPTLGLLAIWLFGSRLVKETGNPE
jgi:hypothetical protein